MDVGEIILKRDSSQMLRLKDKVAVVTGASSGIGEAIARTFAREGARVVVNYHRSEAAARRIVAEIVKAGGEAVAVGADVKQLDEVRLLVDETLTAFGPAEVWVNNAGVDILTEHADRLDDHAKLNALIDVDLKGTINCCWTIVPIMAQIGCGTIINITWDLALHGFAGRNPQMFAAVKAGVHGFGQSLAKSVAPRIRVNAVAPGWIETQFARESMASEYYQQRLAEIPLARFGVPQDVADAVLYLASDEAAYVTGQTIKVNGGLV